MDANAFLQNQVQFQFVNANGANAVAPNPSISISGKDANLVFDINGGKEIKLDGQFAKLVVSPGMPLSEDNPAIFKIRAEAPGFLPFEKEIAIQAADSFMTYTLEMVDLNNTPEGVRYDAGNAQQLAVGDQLKIGKPLNSGFSAELSMPKNNTITDVLGIKENIQKIELVQLDPSNQMIASKIPNLIPDFTDRVIYEGAESDLGFFPIGYVQMNVNDKKGKISFEKPASMNLYIQEGTIDPISNEALKAGDAMQVYQWDESGMAWKFLSNANIVKGANGNLMVEATVATNAVVAVLSTPTLTPITGSTCRSITGFQFRRNSNVNTKHYMEVVSANSPSTIYVYVSDVIIANNSTYNFGVRLPNRALKVNIYEYETFANKGRLIVSQNLSSPCNFTTSRRFTINVNPPTVTNRKIARFELDTYCPTSRLFYYHEGRIEYKRASDPDNAPWFDLGLARRSGRTVSEIIRNVPNLPPVSTPSYSYLETDRLENGVTYKFRVTISGRPAIARGSSNATITETFIKTRIFDETEFLALRGTSPVGYNYLKFKNSYWIANADGQANPCGIWRY
jgi:hypothetical protein